jgi:hypothetical protein
MKYNWQSPLSWFLCKSFFTCSIVFCSVIYSWAGANPFIQTVLVLYKSTILPEDVPNLAKYDVLDLNRFNYKDVNQATWAAIKVINPSIEIYIYQLGPESNINQESESTVYLNSIARITNARGHSMGALDTNNSKLFLLDGAANRIYNQAYPNSVLMDFGSSDYQAYWKESTLTDIVNQAWKADGIHVDNCIAAYSVTSNPLSSVYPASYPNATSWNGAMNNFVNAITSSLHTTNQKVYANRGNSRSDTGYSAWIALDGSSNPPDIVEEEGAFAVYWGTGSVQFYEEADWKRQVDVISKLQHSKAALLSHSDLTKENPNGIDNLGKPVTFYQTLWYAMCSYHLARKDAPNNAYFMFGGTTYKSTPWFDEYDRINLGKAVSIYSSTTVAGVKIYFREFEKGFVFVNSTTVDAKAVPLPVQCVQITHENINVDPIGLPVISNINIPSHNGIIVLKKDSLFIKLIPTNLRVK